MFSNTYLLKDGVNGDDAPPPSNTLRPAVVAPAALAPLERSPALLPGSQSVALPEPGSSAHVTRSPSVQDASLPLHCWVLGWRNQGLTAHLLGHGWAASWFWPHRLLWAFRDESLWSFWEICSLEASPSHPDSSRSCPWETSA